MSYRAPTPQEEISDQHADMAALVKTYLPAATTVTLVSINGEEGGQLILHDPSYDKQEVIKRIRLCADLLEREGR